MGRFSIRLLGERPIRSFEAKDGETKLLWIGKNSDQAVVDITHAMNTTLENIRILAEAEHRFRYGIFAHRTDSALSGNATLPAPTALTLFNVGVSPGKGAFTIGVRINNEHERADIDQNVDHNFFDTLYISGATDDNGDTPNELLDGMNSAGIYLDGSQVQANYLKNINVEKSGTGIFVWDGQLELFGGSFTKNIQPGSGADQSLADDNHSSHNDPLGRGGGDFVFRTGYTGGQVIQDVTSQGSFRFLTSFWEDGVSSSENPAIHTGRENDWAQHYSVALAVLNAKVLTTAHPDGEVVFMRNGGPVVFIGCDFGGKSGIPQKITAAEPTMASVVIARSRFNHAQPPFYQTLKAPFEPMLPQPEYFLLDSQGWGGKKKGYLNLPNAIPAQKNQTRLVDALTLPLELPQITARSYHERPVLETSMVVNLAEPFEYQGKQYTAHYLSDDPELYTFDNTPVIQAAIDKIKSNAKSKGKGVVWFPAGHFRIDSSIILKGVDGVALMGIGGRSGAVVLSSEKPTQGTILAWNGKVSGQDSRMIIVDGSQHVLISGFLLTTIDRPSNSLDILMKDWGARTVDTMIHLSEMSGETSHIWIDDISVDWHGGYGDIPPNDLGVTRTILRLGDGDEQAGPDTITFARVNAAHIAEQGVLLDGRVRDVQLQGYAINQSRRAIRSLAGGEFAWFGGGAGNNVADMSTLTPAYPDPVIVDLDRVTGTISIAGLELQDNYPTRVLRTSERALPESTTDSGAGRIFMYGNNHLFAAPIDDQRSIDFRWQAGGEFKPQLNLYADALNFLALGVKPPHDILGIPFKITAQNGSHILALGTFSLAVGKNPPWESVGTSQIEAIGSRAYDPQPGLAWDEVTYRFPYFLTMQK